MSYFSHKFFCLKDAWKNKKIKITGHVLFLKEAWKEKEKIITGHILFWKETCKKK